MYVVITNTLGRSYYALLIQGEETRYSQGYTIYVYDHTRIEPGPEAESGLCQHPVSYTNCLLHQTV